VSGAVLEAQGQRAAHGIALAVGELGLENARGTGSEEHTHTPRAPPCGCLLHGFEKTVLLHGELGQPVIPALELVQILRQPRSIDARDFANVGFDVHGFEVAAFEAAALLEQALQSRRDACPNATGRREILE
jgi:hypothetical protein